jgi:hypothetical protein
LIVSFEPNPPIYDDVEKGSLTLSEINEINKQHVACPLALGLGLLLCCYVLGNNM